MVRETYEFTSPPPVDSMIEARSMRSEEVSLATCSLRSHFLRFRSEQKAHSDRAHTPLSSLALLVSE